jgi:uncharacterized membrane protein YidH (DUF202 family)
LATVIFDLLPLIVGATAVPLYPIVVLLFLLQDTGGLAKALSFVAGGIAMRLLQGLFFGLVLGAAVGASSEEGQRLGVSILLLIVGILLLITAFKKWQKEDDPDAPPLRWMAAISGMSAVRAVGAGALYLAIAVKQWVFTLSAIGLISEAGLAESAGVGLYLFYVVATQMLVLPPILVYAVAPQRADRVLKAAQTWLERHDRTILVSVSLVFGVWFSYKGITGLIG